MLLKVVVSNVLLFEMLFRSAKFENLVFANIVNNQVKNGFFSPSFANMLKMLRAGVNFTNILLAAFAPVGLRQSYWRAAHTA